MAGKYPGNACIRLRNGKRNCAFEIFDSVSIGAQMRPKNISIFNFTPADWVLSGII